MINLESYPSCREIEVFMNLKKDKCFRKHAKNLSSHRSQWKYFRGIRLQFFSLVTTSGTHLRVRFRFDTNQESRLMHFESCERNPTVFVVKETHENRLCFFVLIFPCSSFATPSPKLRGNYKLCNSAPHNFFSFCKHEHEISRSDCFLT